MSASAAVRDTVAVAAAPGAGTLRIPAVAASVETVSVAAGAAVTTTADSLTTLLGPIQSLIEGAFLLVRRTLFNQPPTVAPVQISGQTSGPITGTIGAADREGDPIVYSVTSNPQAGTVVVGPQGDYVYTPGASFNGIDTFTVAAADLGFHINLFNPLRPAHTLANVVVDQGRGARVQFDFRYGGGALLWSQEARSALQTAATILSSYFDVDAPVTVTYDVKGQFNLLSGQLASATSDMISSQPGFFPTVVQQKIIAGVDVNGATADGAITWNFANSWSLSGQPSGGQYDFQSVAMHEMLHTFGFLSAVGQPGSNIDTTWTAYDGLLVTADGTPVIGPDYVFNPAYDANLSGGAGGLFLGGPAAVAAFGGVVPLYTPDPWQGGSSVSHLSDYVFVGRNKQLMVARVNTGTGIKTLSPVETAILADLGYTMVQVPAGSAALTIGLVLLRRRRTVDTRR